MALLGFLLFVFSFVSVTATKPGPSFGAINDISFSNFIPHQGYRVSETPLKKVDLDSLFDCLIECTTDTRCLSANINTTSNDQGLLDCELLDTDIHQSKNNLTKVEGIDHYALPVPCHCLKGGGWCIKSANSTLSCACAPGYKGDRCQSNYHDCSEIHAAGFTNDGVYTINPDGRGRFKVLCDMTTDGGGWIVFHKRFDLKESFNRNWEAYKNGFGNLSHGEFWLGNEHVYRLTAAKSSALRVDLETTNGLKRFANYSTFLISGHSDSYRLHVAGYSGTAGDSLNHPSSSYKSNGMKFSTPDRDNDLSSGRCATSDGWWYSRCTATYLTRYNNMAWGGSYMKKASMKLRPKDP